jgi:hypothetical protein
MFQRGDDAGILEPAHVGRGDGADEIGVLADGLFHAPPARVAHDIEHGREALVHADGSEVATDVARHALDERGVERGTPRQWHRIGRGAPCRETGQALLVSDGRDAEAVRANDALLRALQGARTHGGVDGRAAERPGQLPEAVGEQRVEVDVVVHIVLVRGHLAAVVRGAHPHTIELSDLLLERHLGDQGRDAAGCGLRRVVPERQARIIRRLGVAVCRPLSGPAVIVNGHGYFPPMPMRPCTRARRAKR